MHALALAHKYDSARGFWLFQQMHQQRGFVLDIVGAIVPLVDLFAFAGGR